MQLQRKPLFKRMLGGWQLYTLILPAVITVFIFHYVPIYGLLIAFKSYRPSRGILGSEWVGLKWFVQFFHYRDFWPIIRNTLSISIYALATFPCAVIFALMINEVRSPKYKKYVQMVSYAPHFVSTVIVCSMLILFTQYNNGLFNNLRARLGLARMDVITVPKYFSSLYVWSGVWQNVGWDTIIYLAALAGISPELVEAAKHFLHILFMLSPRQSGVGSRRAASCPSANTAHRHVRRSSNAPVKPPCRKTRVKFCGISRGIRWQTSP